MSTTLTVNGTVYPFPTSGETGWASDVETWARAVSTMTLQKNGGTFTLTADANFGATYGLLSQYFTSRTASAATAGQVRLARADTVRWRNQAGDGNLALGPGSDNLLEFNSIDLVDVSTSQTLTNKTLTTPTITTEAWQTFSLVNSWVDLAGAYGSVRYRKLANGDVELRGAVKNGSGGTATIATLPSGYRPVGTIIRPVCSNGRIVFLSITSAGVMAGVNSNTENVDTLELVIDGVTFPTT